jgi:DNA-binding XRE family transcriptional regulator
MTRTWEDHINPTGHDDVLIEQRRHLAEQRAAIDALRGTIPDCVPLWRRHRTDTTAADGERLSGERIKAIRTALGLSQDKMAWEIGVNQKTYCAWENGVNQPRQVVHRRDLLALERQAKERVA